MMLASVSASRKFPLPGATASRAKRSAALDAQEEMLARHCYDAASGTNYNYFRDYDPAIGRYIESDPIGLRAGLNTYAYVGGSPLSFNDRFGLDAVFVHFIGYNVGSPGGISVPLGHSGVIAVDPDTGRTQYYEFGRYGGKCGNVEGPFDLGRIKFDDKRNPTPDSLELALRAASHARGKDSPAYSEYSRRPYQDVIDYAEKRKRQANSCERPYKIITDNCNNFAREAAGQ